MGKITDVEVAKKLISIESSANSRGIDFNISFRKMKQLLERDTCFYTGKRFEPTGDFARSIDRIDNDLGYIDSNVCACTIDINRKKKDLTSQEIVLIFKKIIKHVPSHK